MRAQESGRATCRAAQMGRAIPRQRRSYPRPKLPSHPRAVLGFRALRACWITASISAGVMRLRPARAASARIALTARRARANSKSWTSSTRVDSSVGTIMPRGTPSLVTIRDRSRARRRHTCPGRAASSREAIVFMHNTILRSYRANKSTTVINVARPSRTEPCTSPCAWVRLGPAKPWSVRSSR